MVQNLDIDERGHALSILQRLDQMRHDRQYCDFIVSVDGVEHNTHRIILSAGSDYFNAMLCHDTKESQLGKVEMIGVDRECVTVCINYIYTGKAEIPEGKTEHLICASTLMQLDKLSIAISLLLEKNLNTNTFYFTRRIAEMYCMQDLVAACRTFEQENIFPLSFQRGFQSEEYVHIAEILTSVPLSEQEKLIVSLQWVGSFAERKSDLLNFLKSIDLEEVSKYYLIHILESNDLIKSDFELYKIFNNPLVRKLKLGNSTIGGKSLILFDETSDSLRQLNHRTNNVENFHDKEFAQFRDFSAIALHSCVYILCDDQSVHRLRFQDKKAKWEKMQDMIKDHGAYPPSVCLNGLLYVIGGDREQTSSAAEKFYPGLNRWIQLKEKPINTTDASLVTLDGSIYSIGGETDEEPSNAFHEFNSQSAEWTELEPMLQAKHLCGATAVNQKIYVLGGVVDDEYVNDMDCYDVALKQWTALSPMIEVHGLMKAHYMCGWIFVVERFEESDAIEKYSIERDEWQTVTLNGTDVCGVYDSVLV